MFLVKPLRVLEDICVLNNYPWPVYKFVQKYYKSNQVDEYRKWYQVNVYIDGHAFSGHSVSRRMAKNFAANEAIKRLRFKKCRRNAVTELVQLCADHSLTPPFFTQNFKDGIYCSVVKAELQDSNHSLSLDGKGSSDSAKVAKVTAAKDLLDQLIVIFEYASYDPPK